MTPLAAYVLLFVAVGVGFIFIHLMAGKIIRPNKPDPAKRTIYECGEPTIGSSWIQFDLRFYVIALLFVIFDVEVAFFFPWAVVFGKANTLAAVSEPRTAEDYKETTELAWDLMPPTNRTLYAPQHEQLSSVKSEDIERLKQLRAKRQTAGNDMSQAERAELEDFELHKEHLLVETRNQARSLAWLSLVEIAVFFGVLLVGFAYLWHRGDLAWVRSLAAERPSGEPLPSSPAAAPVAKVVPMPQAEPVAHT
jgi:NADH-quinone oxidoreductase subunit A